jgi:hypothetical protein
MYDCPKFDSCSAPICPLSRKIEYQSMGNGERVCFYLTEYQKFNSEASFKVLGLEELCEAMSQAMDEIHSKPHTSIYLKRALQLASQSSSRMARGIELKNQSVGVA